MSLAETDAAMPSAFDLPRPAETLEFTGERYVSGLIGEIQSEHYHRYFFALGFCAGKDVLDVASGEGYGSALLGQVARNVIGVDVDEGAVQFANRNYLSKRVSFRLGDATELPVPSQSVDVVVSFETIEHVRGQEEFLREIRRVLRPDGVLIMSSPNKDLYLKDQAENPYHVRELDKQEFRDLLQAHFRQVTLLEQRAFTGSVIVREGGRESAAVEGFGTEDCQRFTRGVGVPDAPYLVAVASDREGLSVPDSFFYNPRWLWRLEELRLQSEAAAKTATETAAEEIAATSAQNAAVTAENAALKREVGALRIACEKAEEAALAAIEAVNAGIALAHGEAEMLRRSTSWRITAPLRSAAEILKRLLRR